jgi:protein phosphatase
MNPMTQPLDLPISTCVDPQGLEQEGTQRQGITGEDFSGDMATVVLPNKMVHLEAMGITDLGRARHQNEDFFVVDHRVNQLSDPNDSNLETRGLYILCDGMGGHAKGEVASRMATAALTQYFAAHWHSGLPSEEDLKNALHQANQALYALNESQTRSGNRRMGTTLVLALLQDTQFRFAHVGDSRLYRLTHQHGLQQLTVDHEVGQRDISRGIAPRVAYARPDAYQLTQALGPRSNEVLRPEIQSLTINEDTFFLLCSDGLTDNDVLERHWETHLQPLLDDQNSLEEGLRALIELANTENGHDNITVIGIRAKVLFQRVPLFSVPTTAKFT